MKTAGENYMNRTQTGKDSVLKRKGINNTKICECVINISVAGI